MFAILVAVVIVSGAALVIMVVVKVRSAKRSRIRRTVASPYGMLVGPTDAELRRAREVHPENMKIIVATDRRARMESSRECLHCGAIYDFDEEAQCFFATCQCGVGSRRLS